MYKIWGFLLIVGTAVMLMGPPLNAKPAYLYDMTQLYPQSRIATGCSYCHEARKDYTAHGQDFMRLRERYPLNMRKVWVEFFRLDSDKDGIDNDLEMRRDIYQ